MSPNLTQPSISIITPYRNSAKYLPRFVASIKAQTYANWICIMVDDGSLDDGPVELKRLVADEPRFKLIRNTLPKTWPGPASARNCALSYVNTDLVAFCDVDDLWHSQKLELQIRFHSLRNLDLSVSAYGRFYQGQLHEPIKSVICPPLFLVANTLVGRNPIPMLTVVLSAELAVSRFKEVPHEDFLFWLELFRSNPSLRYGCIPCVLSFYCIHGDSLSGRKIRMPVWVYKVYRNLGESRLASLCLLVIWAIAHSVPQAMKLQRSRSFNYSVMELMEMPPVHLR